MANGCTWAGAAVAAAPGTARAALRIRPGMVFTPSIGGAPTPREHDAWAYAVCAHTGRIVHKRYNRRLPASIVERAP
jgi:hypothetical protein